MIIEMVIMSEDYVRKTVKINEDLWNKFQKKIEEEYGTTYKHTSEEIEKALENYITEDVYDAEITKTKINNLNDEKKKLKKDYDTLKDSLDKKENEYENLNNEFERLNNENEDNKKLIAQQEKNILEHENENKLLKSDIERANEDLSKRENDIKKLEKEIEDQKNRIYKLTNDNKVLEDRYRQQVDETNKQVQENTKIKNKREHAQERLNKTQDELNDTLKRLEKYSYAIGQVQNMSFIDRLLNRLPEEIKQLKAGGEEKKEEVKID